MKLCGELWLLMIVAMCVARISAQGQEKLVCLKKGNSCFGKPITCPKECPLRVPNDVKAKACYVNCDSPLCSAVCRYRKPSCNGVGAACYDPRFIGPDGGVFYFHGRRGEHFTLVSDTDLQINARFIGRRPMGRPRDNTWIQALGVLFGAHNFSVEATKAATWDDAVDHLKFTFDGIEIASPPRALSEWKSEKGDVTLERVSDTNSAIVTADGIVEIGVTAVPITKEDDRIHNYQIPSDDCFSHLEVQFKFFGLSRAVEGVLGRTYQPDYESSSKLGLAMAVVGGERFYKTTSLFATDCKKCLFAASSDGDTRSTNKVLEAI